MAQGALPRRGARLSLAARTQQGRLQVVGRRRRRGQSVLRRRSRARSRARGVHGQAAQVRRLVRRAPHRRRVRRSFRLGRAALRPAGCRYRPGDDGHQRGEGRRDRRGLLLRRAARNRALRRDDPGWIPVEQRRRDARRNIDRPGHRRIDRDQANLEHSPAAAHHRHRGQLGDDRDPWATRPVRRDQGSPDRGGVPRAGAERSCAEAARAERGREAEGSGHRGTRGQEVEAAKRTSGRRPGSPRGLAEWPDNRRYYGLDALRGGMMLLGVVLHSATLYIAAPPPHLPIILDPNTSLVMDAIMDFIHAFRMPTFFVLAGFFTALLVEKRGVWGAYRNRLARIAAPLLAGMLTILPVTLLFMFDFAISAHYGIRDLFPSLDDTPRLHRVIRQPRP